MSELALWCYIVGYRTEWYCMVMALLNGKEWRSFGWRNQVQNCGFAVQKRTSVCVFKYWRARDRGHESREIEGEDDARGREKRGEKPRW